MSRKKKLRKVEYKDVELNIMPFIDIFSMLNTFLLFSAVFLSMGILEVQIPFLSSSPPPDDPKEAREFKVSIDVTKEQVEVQTSFTMPPEQLQKFPFPLNKDGIVQLHNKLTQLRKENPDTDKATVYSDDDVLWDDLSQVLDATMVRLEKDPVFAVPKDALAGKEKDPRAREKAELLTKAYVYPKVVIGSVMLK